MTSVSTIRGWFQSAKEEDQYMIVWCDSYDYSDYPAYYDSRERAQYALNNPSSMQRAMDDFALTFYALVHLKAYMKELGDDPGVAECEILMDKLSEQRASA